MSLGGISFVVHYRLLRGKISALWESMEIRLFWKIVLGATLLVFFNHARIHGFAGSIDAIRYSLFQVVAVLTTTGFGTKDIGAAFFPALAKQVFLFLMIVGGMVGSTSGGLKVFRIGVLWEMVKQQVRRIVNPGRAVNPLLVDGEILPAKEIRRISALFFAWLVFIIVGGMVTAFFSNLSPLASLSGMFSALGNIGPSYIPLTQWPGLHPIVKLTYIFGMLAGRLEILPVLLLFSRRVWR
jgi:trk system potassium uptake protein TrkH